MPSGDGGHPLSATLRTSPRRPPSLELFGFQLARMSDMDSGVGERPLTFQILLRRHAAAVGAGRALVRCGGETSNPGLRVFFRCRLAAACWTSAALVLVETPPIPLGGMGAAVARWAFAETSANRRRRVLVCSPGGPRLSAGGGRGVSAAVYKVTNNVGRDPRSEILSSSRQPRPTSPYTGESERTRCAPLGHLSMSSGGSPQAKTFLPRTAPRRGV